MRPAKCEDPNCKGCIIMRAAGRKSAPWTGGIMTDAVWAWYAEAHPERVGNVAEKRPFWPPVPDARTCIDCGWEYRSGGDDPSHQASDQRCHWCNTLMRLRTQALNRTYARRKQVEKRWAGVLLLGMAVVFALFLLALGWS